ncbi:MAG: hypothetical protein WBA74_14515 [Cyclobacteriaceae bacterium]
MEGIFEEEVSSFISGNGNFWVGDISGDIAAAICQGLLPSNDSSSNFYSNTLPTSNKLSRIINLT